MSHYEIENTQSGHVLGVYEGDTKEEAIRAMLVDAGSSENPDPNLVAREMVDCECGAATGVPCGQAVSPSDVVTVEWMPPQWRESHTKAGNRGRYPYNGSERLRCDPDHAEQLVEDDPEWAEVLENR